MDAANKKAQPKQSFDVKQSETINARVTSVKKLFGEWLQDTSGYDEQAWPQIKIALNENHSKSHKLFDE